MAKIKLTKNELKVQKDYLKMYRRYLPTLTLKKQQLQTEIRTIEAKALAVSVQEKFNLMERATRTCNALTGDYYLLNCSEFPSIIAECGFLSNQEEEALLISDDYQEEIAYAIYQGIVGYLSEIS